MSNKRQNEHCSSRATGDISITYEHNIQDLQTTTAGNYKMIQYNTKQRGNELLNGIVYTFSTVQLAVFKMEYAVKIQNKNLTARQITIK
jgi:hypothetical protein